MVQHLLLTLVGPPLLLLARADHPAARRRRRPRRGGAGSCPCSTRGSSGGCRSRCVAWMLFAGVMWASHFSPLFDLALENPWVHRLEHALFLVAALLFWWPVVGPDPSPWKLKPAARVLYVGLQMPQNTFLALAIYMASAPLYAHYATTAGPGARRRSRTSSWPAGSCGRRGHGVHRDGHRADLGVDARRGAAERRGGPAARAERAAIREREVRLAARRAAEAAAAGGPSPGRRRADRAPRRRRGSLRLSPARSPRVSARGSACCAGSGKSLQACSRRLG